MSDIEKVKKDNLDFPYITNICYVFNKDGAVLLQHKRRGFGQGKWNGVGGKVKDGETIEDSVRREAEEETGLRIGRIKKMGVLEFIFTNNQESNNHSYVFICRNYYGTPRDTGEGELKWFKLEDIPLDKMWDDDRFWLLDLLAGKYQHKRFYFDQDGKVLEYEEL
jgi:8-oxo-dGTP pyrophosphatase MutT (NUDIX family)